MRTFDKHMTKKNHMILLMMSMTSASDNKSFNCQSAVKITIESANRSFLSILPPFCPRLLTIIITNH